MGPPAMALALVVALAAAGLAWHECMLLVTAALAAQRLELLRMERAGPLDAWRIGARCLLAGSAGLFGSVVLAVVLLAAAAGWWRPSHDQPVLTVGLIATVGAVITAMQMRVDRVFAEGGLWLLSVLGATTGILVATGGGSAWTCLVSGAGVVYLAWTSWQLATAGASFLRTD